MGKGVASGIFLYIGAMFSGKTSALITDIDRAVLARRRVLLVKYAGDTRFDDGAAEPKLTTHAGLSRTSSERLTVVAATRLADVDAEGFEVIGVDEGQFFDDIVPYCELWANAGRHVVVAALSGNSERKQFGTILDLIPLCEDVKMPKAICMQCGDECTFTRRRRPTADASVRDIGGVDKYYAACRACYMAAAAAEAALAADVAATPVEAALAVGVALATAPVEAALAAAPAEATPVAAPPAEAAQ